MIASDSFIDDTDPAVVKVVVDRLKRMTPEEKVRRTLSLSRMVKNLIIADVTKSHPYASSEELKKRIYARLYGRETALRCFQWDPEIEGW